jgi:hypothetical protein
VIVGGELSFVRQTFDLRVDDPLVLAVDLDQGAVLRCEKKCVVDLLVVARQPLRRVRRVHLERRHARLNEGGDLIVLAVVPAREGRVDPVVHVGVPVRLVPERRERLQERLVRLWGRVREDGGDAAERGGSRGRDEVGGAAPREGEPRVNVRVHDARHDELPRRVDHVRPRNVQVAADLRDAPVLDEDRCGVGVDPGDELSALDEDGHGHASTNAATASASASSCPR